MKVVDQRRLLLAVDFVHGEKERAVRLAQQAHEFTARRDAYELMVAAVAALNPDDMSPREAMEALYMLKKKLEETEKKN